jgi:NitT/TauT family transport system permease protein
MEAARNIPSIYLKVGRSFGMSRFQVVRYVLMPGVFVHIISGLRIGFSLTFLGVIVAEYFSSYNGLGYLLNVLLTGQQTAGVLGVIVIIFAIAAIGHLLFILLERRVAARGVDQDLTQELSELR